MRSSRAVGKGCMFKDPQLNEYREANNLEVDQIKALRLLLKSGCI